MFLAKKGKKRNLWWKFVRNEQAFNLKIRGASIIKLIRKVVEICSFTYSRSIWQEFKRKFSQFYLRASAFFKLEIFHGFSNGNLIAWWSNLFELLMGAQFNYSCCWIFAFCKVFEDSFWTDNNFKSPTS